MKCMDFIRSKDANKYLIVVSCYLTKWVDLIPLQIQEAKYVASKLVNRFISKKVIIMTCITLSNGSV